MKRIKHKGSSGTGRKENSARLFLKPFPRAAALASDPVIKGMRSIAVQEGAAAYLAGGVLRNLALSRPPAPDYDFVSGGDIKKISERAARMFKGASFLLDKETPSYRVVVKARGRRRAVVLDFSPIKGGGIMEDLKARDFTVNALGISLDEAFSGEPRVLDPTGGLKDAAKKVLRAASPGVFDEDPLRVMRAVRISQQYGLKIARETLALMRSKAGLLSSVSRERVRDELILMFSCPGTVRSVELMYGCGIIDAILPEAGGWAKLDGYNLKAHALATLAEAEFIIEGVSSGEYLAPFPGLRAYLRGSIGPLSRIALLKLAAFFHDAGKPLAISRESGRLRFIGHDDRGAPVVKEMMTRLRFSGKAAKELASMVRNHHRAFMLADLKEPTPRARAHFFRAAGGEPGLLLLLLALADARATRGEEDTELLAVAAAMFSFYWGQYTRRRPKPILGGREIMKAFKVPEGRIVGEIIGKISEGVEKGVVTDRKEAIAYVREWLKSRKA